ncbi:MAG: hypothetical protein V1773_09420 [bacterium]
MKLTIIIFFVCINIFAQDFNLTLNPSTYYTYGNYNKNKSSQGYSAYASLGINYYDYITLGFDNTIINDKTEFKYDQKFVIVSGLKNLFPYYIKLNYGYAEGKYDYKPFEFIYKDYTNLYNISLTRYFNNFYAGISYSFINVYGHKGVKIHQPQLILDWIFMPNLIISYRGIYSKVKSDLPIYEEFLQGELSDDNRSLYSNSFSLNYYLSEQLFMRTEVTLGKKAYYFNTDYLTFFNQDDTQNFSFSTKVDSEIFKNFRINFSYQYLTLDHSKINYYSVGLKYNFIQLL